MEVLNNITKIIVFLSTTFILGQEMDVEGAEMEALAGSEILLKDRKPDLAIAIYHKARHLWEIPLFLKDIVPEYNIYIDHKYGAADESICFATVRS